MSFASKLHVQLLNKISSFLWHEISNLFDSSFLKFNFLYFPIKDSIVNNSSIDTDYGTAELSTLNVEVIESFPVNSPRDLIKSSTNSQNRSLEIAANIVGIDSKKKLISKSEAELSETEKPETKISTATLSILLGTIYGLAFIFAVVWVVWFMLRKKPEPDNLKRQRDIENRLSQDTLSICSNI